MLPPDYSNFIVASTQASAALIGLLFVSVSVAPERVFGEKAEPSRRALALSAFTALANVFFVSFGGLVPHLLFGVMILIAGGIATSQTLALLQHIPSWRRSRVLVRGLFLFAVSGAVYGYEIAIGVQLTLHPADPQALTALLGVLLGAYAIGLARAWQLLGATEARGLAGTSLGWLRGRFRGDAQPPKSSSAEPAKRSRQSR